MQSYKSNLNNITLYEDALPDALFSRLYSAMLAIGDERPEGKDTYAKTFWMNRDAAATNIAEESVLALEKVTKPPSDCIGMEWWVGRLKRGKKLSFHFDRDLSLSRESGIAVYPILSSVFYLKQYHSSPTVLLDQVPGADGKSRVPKKAKMSTSVMAIPNHYVVFPGNLRHGVIPDKDKLERDDPNEYRLSLLVNYWDRRPSPPVCCDYDGTTYRSLSS